MPKAPVLNPALATITSTLWAELEQRLVAFSGLTYPFHVGDTWRSPAEVALLEKLTLAAKPDQYRYAPPQGIPQLLEALAQHLEKRMNENVTPEGLAVTAGAIGGLAATMGAILAPDDEVLVLAPYWPVIDGIIRCNCGRPVPIPFYDRVMPSDDAIALLEKHVNLRTVAVYLNSPNNPSGVVLAPQLCESLVAWAASHDLWVVSDEVYEDYVFEGTHTHMRVMDPTRVLSVHSFSKAYGMAGNRCGYVCGPRSVIARVRSVSTHNSYGAPVAAQWAACRVLGVEGDRWIADAKQQYREIGIEAASILGVTPPAGGVYLFFDISCWLDGRGVETFLNACVEQGILVAPGTMFGPYPDHIRVCYSSCPPEMLREGCTILAGILQGG